MKASPRTIVAIASLAILISIGLISTVAYYISKDSWNKSQDETCVDEIEKQTCHTTELNPYRFYGTKTAYHIALESRRDKRDDEMIEGCSPAVFYLISRHGIRYPDKDLIIKMMEKLPEFQANISKAFKNNKAGICNNDFQRLLKWNLTYGPKDGKQLSISGGVEAENLAIRLKNRFPGILNQSYSEEKFKIEYTSLERTRDTAKAFAKGLFNQPNFERIAFLNNTNEDILRFYKECDRLKVSCKNSTYDVSEIEKFKEGPMIHKMLESVSARVGFSVSAEDVKLMYTACVFGYALGDDDIWCSMFSRDDLKILEFLDDIENYYEDGYGNRINSDQACPVIKYIVDLFNSQEHTQNTRAVLHFTHAHAVQKIYASFGLYKDKLPLKADKFCTQTHRLWRSSTISPFNSNIAFVLFNCNGTYKVGALHNEKWVKIMGCDQTLCPLDNVYSVYGPVAKLCDIKGICGTCRM